MKSPITAQLSWITRDDLAEVAALSQECYGDSWTAEEFGDVCSRRDSIGIVAKHRGQVVGYVIYELHPDRIYLIDLVVRPSHRGHRIGAQLVAHVATKLHWTHRSHIALAIDEQNLNGQLFFSAMGFRAVCVKRGYWDEHEGDAYVMRLDCESEVSTNG